MLTMTPKDVAIGISLFGGAAITLGTIVFAIVRVSSKAFASGVDTHVSPLFQKLGHSLDKLTDAVGDLKTEHEKATRRTDERLNEHDGELGELGERVATIEGKLDA